jgi:hypothetical protein
MRASGGALRSGGIPTVNMDAETNPKAKTITTIRYVHRKRISERFWGKGDETVAEKVDDPAVRWACCVKTPSPDACQGAAPVKAKAGVDKP